MKISNRKQAFVLVATEHGPMLVNRFDAQPFGEEGQRCGVGHQLLEFGSFDPFEIEAGIKVLDAKRKYYGDAVIAVDVGANLGTHTITWAKHMHEWGVVFAFEPQEYVFYALCGNIILNNCFNVRAEHCAIGQTTDVIEVPDLDYTHPSNFGGLSLKGDINEIGQDEDLGRYAVRQTTLDAGSFTRCDFVKIDVEGMELEVLEGAKATIERCRPALFIEHVKTGPKVIREWLEPFNYQIVAPLGGNFLAMHINDKAAREFV
jgi:FkbM family methyltransferase